jgi:heme exporter protein A
LCATNVTYERNEQVIFSKVSLALGSGEMLQIQGANGAGKTTLMRILAGLLPASRGQITWNGELLADCSEVFYTNVLYISHNPGIKLGLTVKENLQLMLALAVTKKKEEQLNDAMKSLNLLAFKDVYAEQLSAGQQRRVALAKLFLLSKKLWLLDEPFAALDQAGITMMHELMSNHLQQKGMIVVTSHQSLMMQQGVAIHHLRLDHE